MKPKFEIDQRVRYKMKFKSQEYNCDHITRDIWVYGEIKGVSYCSRSVRYDIYLDDEVILHMIDEDKLEEA